MPTESSALDQTTIMVQSQQAFATIYSTLLMVIQNNLLPKIKTGNTIIDTLISTIIIITIGYSLLHFQQNGTKIFNTIVLESYTQLHDTIWPPPIEQMIRVNEMDDSNSYNNIYFQAFIWYLSKQAAACDRGKLRIFAGSQQPSDRILPENNLTFTFRHHDKIITYSLGQDRYRYAVFTIHDVNAIPILDFLHEIRQEHSASLVTAPQAKEWLQRRFENRNTDWVCVGYTYNTKTFDTLVLDEGDKADLLALVQAFTDGEGWCKKMGVSWQDGILLSGAPGMGKTSIIKAVSFMMRRDVYVLDLNPAAVKTNDDLRKLFHNLPHGAFLVLEDVDCMTDALHARDGFENQERMANRRRLQEQIAVAKAFGAAARAATSPTESQKPQQGPQRQQHDNEDETLPMGITLDCLLNLLDGLTSCHGLFTVMATNHPELLDPALIRAGRCNIHLRLRPCTAAQVDQFYGLFYGENNHLPTELMRRIPDRVLTPAEVFGYFRRYMYNKQRAIEKFSDFVDYKIRENHETAEATVLRKAASVTQLAAAVVSPRDISAGSEFSMDDIYTLSYKNQPLRRSTSGYFVKKQTTPRFDDLKGTPGTPVEWISNDGKSTIIKFADPTRPPPILRPRIGSNSMKEGDNENDSPDNETANETTKILQDDTKILQDEITKVIENKIKIVKQ